MTENTKDGGLTEEKRAELVEKHGPLAVIRVREGGQLIGTIVCRRPTRGDYNRFQDKVAEGKGSRSSHLENFVRSSVVYPDSDTFDALAEKKPAMATNLGGKLLELAGSEDDVELLGN